MYYCLSMKIINTILFMAVILCFGTYSFAEADYPALTKNSRSRSSLSSLPTYVTLKSDKELEKDGMKKYYMSSPGDKPKTRRYSLTGDPIYKDPSILRKNREKDTSKDVKNNLIADPTKISKPKKSYSKYYKRKEYNYDFLYDEQEPVEGETDSLKLTL